MPSVIENVNGMNMIVSAAARPIAEIGEVDPGELAAVVAFPRPSSSASVSADIIRKPTMISAGAVACGGTIPMIGAKNMNGKKSAPQTTATQPVRPPTPTPDADSM